MSSRGRRQKGKSKGGSSNRDPSPSTYPTAWSEWEWNVEYNCRSRYREVEKENWEWQYDNAATSTNPTPRNTETYPPILHKIPEEPRRDIRNGIDSSFGVSGITTALAAASMSSSQSQQNQGQSMQSNSQGDYSAYPTRLISRNRSSKSEKLDPRFKVHPSKDFKFGRIFKVLWSEPLGSGGTEITERVGGKHGEEAFHKVRRFVVVKKPSRSGHSTCLPIMTYGGYGCLKRGVHAEDHAVVYTSRSLGPYFLDNEGITKPSIRVELTEPKESLEPLSRINYAKIYTVEHNVKVLFIGKVATTQYEQLVVVEYNALHGSIPDRPSVNDGGRSSGEFDYAEGQNSQSAGGASYSPNYTSRPSLSTAPILSAMPAYSVTPMAIPSQFPWAAQDAAGSPEISASFPVASYPHYPLSYPQPVSNIPLPHSGSGAGTSTPASGYSNQQGQPPTQYDSSLYEA